ncbi:DEAD/DEAH box helicase [Sporobolomyces koalae]|uniref:DEAD/DEAH box helicase n=1 Tax=Sporobolomyces koalae TaxID=500713 RepID=UPI00316CA1FD
MYTGGNEAGEGAQADTVGLHRNSKGSGQQDHAALFDSVKQELDEPVFWTTPKTEVDPELPSGIVHQLPTPVTTPNVLSTCSFSADLKALPLDTPFSELDLQRLPPLPDLKHVQTPVDGFFNYPTSPSPRKRTQKPIALERLFPAGTILLRDYRLRSLDHGQELAADGWIQFAPDLLCLTTSPESEALLESSIADEPAQCLTRGKKRGRTARGKSAPARKKAKVVQDRTLDNLVACCQALVCRATVCVTDSTVILRIYLIPEDLPELKRAEYRTGRLKRSSPAIIRTVLSQIRCSTEEWNGTPPPADVTVPRLLDEADDRSLLEIFHEISIPGEGGFEHVDAPQEVKDRLWFALTEQPDDVITDLFPYQRASVAKMLSRELAPASANSPDYIERSSLLNSADSVFVSLDGAVALKPPQLREPKAGILAEDMGVGKSLIILALIMTSRSELPALDGVSTYLDSSRPCPAPVLLTQQSLDFPFAAESQERLRLRPRVPELLHGAEIFMSTVDLEEHEAMLLEQARLDFEESQRHRPLPSLRALALSLVKTSPRAVRYSYDDPFLTGGDMFETLQASPPYYRLYPSPSQLNSREGRRGDLKPLEIVVAATTLLVVPTDLVRQWGQEIEKHLAPGSLRVLSLRTSKDKFRSPQEMATFDLVLMSAARFTDAAETDDRSLRGVHWKRLVVDEGHVLSSGNLTRKLAEELRCESRWAVSGTPSTNLRGASVDGKLAAASNIVGGTREDLDRLGQLYSRFLRHPAFPRPASLRSLVGDHPSRLASVFNSSIIRHHTSLVKNVLTIPPLSVKVTFVEMEEAERKMYNALLAVFASNAIQSQRRDQDYFFHKANVGSLKSLCSNLATASTFFASDEVGHRLREGAGWAQERLDSEKAVKWSEEDRQGLREAIAVMKAAYSDVEWNLMVNEVSVTIEVEGLDDELVKAFNGITSSQNPLGRSLVSLHQLVRLRQDLKELQHIDVKAWNDDEELVEELLTFEARRKRYDVEIASRKSKDEEVVSVFKKRSKKDTTPLVPLPLDSTFRQIQLVRTSSAKINYLIKEFREHPDEKFIVFSSSNVDLIFANLSEALDLFGIPHIIFAGSHARMGQDRGLKAQRFNATSAQEIQVILVDVERGGRGVGLTAASRVIMLEPIWKPDLELQATKRAHRLGQTKPVELQILIVKDTYEDALFKRRAQIAPEDFSKKLKVPQQDSSLRTTLQSAQYLEPTYQAKQGKPVSEPFLCPPVMLLADGSGHDVTRNG